MKKNDGMTLVELMITVVILIIIAAIMVGSIVKDNEKARLENEQRIFVIMNIFNQQEMEISDTMLQKLFESRDDGLLTDCAEEWCDAHSVPPDEKPAMAQQLENRFKSAISKFKIVLPPVETLAEAPAEQ